MKKKHLIIGSLIALFAGSVISTVKKSRTDDHELSIPSQLVLMLWDDANQYKIEHPEDSSSVEEIFNRFYEEAKTRHNNSMNELGSK